MTRQRRLGENPACSVVSTTSTSPLSFCSTEHLEIDCGGGKYKRGHAVVAPPLIQDPVARYPAPLS